MKHRVLKVFLSTLVTASLLTQTAMGAVLPEGTQSELEQSDEGEGEIPENAAGEENGKVPETIPEENQDENAEVIPDENPENIPEEIPEENQENVSGELPEENQEDLQETVSEENVEEVITEETQELETLAENPDEIEGVLAETNNFIPDSVSPNTVVDWKFDTDYFKSGSLETNDLIIWDASGNGNNLQLNTERVSPGQNADSYIKFNADSIVGDGETESVQMQPSAKKTGAFFETVEGAPMNEEEFKEGYTIEAIIKLPTYVNAWSSIFGQKGTGKLAGMEGGEPEANGGLNISGSRELQWNPWTTNNAEIKDNPTTWSDAGGLQPEKWHHVVIKNDGHSTVMIVDGIQVQRCNTFQDQVGIKSLNVGGQKGWVVGTAYWSESDTFSEEACGDAIFKGSIQEIRMSRGIIDPSEYLVKEHVVDDRYNISGNNAPYENLAGEKNYTFVNIPDPQYQTQYKPEIIDAQMEWIRDNRERLHTGMAICVGDLTQDGSEREYKRANQSFSILDEANMPYLVTDGNHDGEMFKQYFGGSRYEGDLGYQGTGPSQISSYSIIRAGSYEYLFLSLPWSDADVAADKDWILNVLNTHKEYPTIVFSHYNTDMETFVKPFDQVFMTVRGHIEDRWVRSFENNFGHKVIDVVTNFQFDLYGGNGWLNTMEFDESANLIKFRSYSPWVEKKMRILNGEIENNGVLLADEMHRFPFDKLNNTVKATDNTTVELNFQERFPKATVSTDKLEENAGYLSEKISEAEELLNTCNALQYTDADKNVLKEKIESAKALYEEYKKVTSVTPVETLNALNDKMNTLFQELNTALETFKVSAKPVVKLTISEGDFTVEKYGNKQLNVVVEPKDAVTKAVKWTSSDTGIVIVDEQGKVTALKEGTAVITATATDGSNIKTSVKCTVVKKEEKPTPTPEADEKKPGTIVKPSNTPTPTPTSKPLVSSGKNPATGDQNGNSFAIVLVALILSAGTLVGIYMKKRRLTNQKR